MGNVEGKPISPKESIYDTSQEEIDFSLSNHKIKLEIEINSQGDIFLSGRIVFDHSEYQKRLGIKIVMVARSYLYKKKLGLNKKDLILRVTG